jgi:hypothetical protein
MLLSPKCSQECCTVRQNRKWAQYQLDTRLQLHQEFVLWDNEMNNDESTYNHNTRSNCI